MHRPARHEEDANGGWTLPETDLARPRRRAVVALLVVMLLLACLEREVCGRHEGSLRSLLAPYIVKFTAGRSG